MPKNKEHHYVPQFYLRNFSENGKTVRAFNIARRLHLPSASIRGQCHRSYLYGRANAKLEGVLAELESAAAATIRGMLRDDRLPEQTRELRSLQTFVLAQWGRTPAAVRLLNLWLTKAHRNVVRSVPSLAEIVGHHVDTMRIEQHDAVQHSIVESVRYVAALYDLRPKLILNTSGIEFVASDAPVAFHNQWTQGTDGFGTIGYACSGLQIFLPIGPSHLLCLYDPEVYRVGRPQDGVVTTADARFVRQMNALQCAYAEENIYYRAASAAVEVDALPWHLREPADAAVASDRFAEDGGRSMLIVTFQRPKPVNLSSSVIRLHSKMADVPISERACRWRPFATQMIDHIHRTRLPERLREDRIPPGAGGRSFRRIDR